jgi:hypothetical protein
MYKVEVTALVLRDKRDNKIIYIHPVQDPDDSVIITYPREYIPSIADVKEAIKGWGEITKRTVYYEYLEGRDIILEDDAKHMPCMGNITVAFETKTIDWE